MNNSPHRFTFLIYRYVVVVLSVVTFFNTLHSQNKDSILTVLKTTKMHDTMRCNLYYILSNIEYDDNIWPKYSYEAFKIASKYVGNKKYLKTKEDTFYNVHLANCYSNLGLIAHAKGNYKAALDYYNQALERERLTNNKVNLGTIYNNIGGVYGEQKINEASIEYFLKGLKLREEINDIDGIEQSYSNLGSAYEQINDTANAHKYYIKALEMFKKTNNLPKGAVTYNNLGAFYREDVKDYKIAEEYFRKSLDIQEKLQNKRGMCFVLGNIGVTLKEQGKNKEAKEFILRAMSIAKELGYPVNIRNQALTLHQIESNLGNWKEALTHYKLYIKMKDSILSIENAKVTLKQQMQSDYEKQKAVDDAVHGKEMQLSGEREQKQRIISIGIGAGLVLILVFAIFVFNRLQVTRKQKAIIEEQKHLVEEKNHIIEEKQKEIIDSINYAKRIQHTLLAHDEFLKDHLPEHFVLFKPKDIVSGDFYWSTVVQSSLNSLNVVQKGNALNIFEPSLNNVERFYLAVCDSTGHGVPGAFMSLLNISFLNEAINEKKIFQPNEILDHVRKRLIDEISKDGGKDGMDAILLCIETFKGSTGSETRKITYAAANNHPVLVSGGNFIELGKDKMPVGKGEKTDPFTLRTIEASPGDSLYLYTDGFADQFGGPKGKKFKYKALNQFLADNAGLSYEEQKKRLDQHFENWKGILEQVDDVCIIGIKL